METVNNQIYLGDSSFIDKVQMHLTKQQASIDIPKVQKRAKPKTLSYYKKHTSNRDKAIIEAYSSGGYSYQEIGDYFGLHFTTIDKIVRGESSENGRAV